MGKYKNDKTTIAKAATAAAAAPPPPPPPKRNGPTSAHIWNIFTERKFITVFYGGGYDLR